MTKKTIYLIRHGQTNFNIQGIVQGSGVDADLNETGKKQALQFYQKYKNVTFNLVITSALKRTQQTAKHFIEQGIEHQILPEFNEINWGALEGQKPTPANMETFKSILKSWKNGNYDTTIAGGESPNSVQKRMQIGIQKLSAMDVETILLVSHGRAMRILLCTMLNIPLSQMDTFPHQNTTLYQLELQDGQFKLILQNDVSHLEV